MSVKKIKSLFISLYLIVFILTYLAPVSILAQDQLTDPSDGTAQFSDEIVSKTDQKDFKAEELPEFTFEIEQKEINKFLVWLRNLLKIKQETGPKETVVTLINPGL